MQKRIRVNDLLHGRELFKQSVIKRENAVSRRVAVVRIRVKHEKGAGVVEKLKNLMNGRVPGRAESGGGRRKRFRHYVHRHRG